MSRQTMSSWQSNHTNANTNVNSNANAKNKQKLLVGSPTATSTPTSTSTTQVVSYRNKSVKSTAKSSLLTQLARSVQNYKNIKRETIGHTDGMMYNGNDEKPWSCKMCKRKYKWKNSLNCHIKNECGQPPKFFCARMCGYKTNINSNMKRHMNSNCKPRFSN